ncbi:MAG: hypothetical protein RL748_1238 [Pseudomonadota bacterium]|jgi:phosphatidylserine synthase
MNVFVSYTRRDGVVTLDMLKRLHSHLLGVCTPFVHAIEQPTIKHQQLSVFLALFRAHIVILIISPGIYLSPWVRLELFVARLLLRPIISIDQEVVAQLSGNSPNII